MPLLRQDLASLAQKLIVHEDVLFSVPDQPANMHTTHTHSHNSQHVCANHKHAHDTPTQTTFSGPVHTTKRARERETHSRYRYTLENTHTHGHMRPCFPDAHKEHTQHHGASVPSLAQHAGQ